MKKELLMTALIFTGLYVPVLAADKVVVIPLGGTQKVAGTDKQLTYNDSGSAAGAEVYYDKTTGFLGINTDTPESMLQIESESATSGNHLVLRKYHDNGLFAVKMQRARGSKTAPTPVTQGSWLAAVAGFGYDGNSFAPSVSMDYVVDGSVSDGVVPGAIHFYTTDDTGTMNHRMVINSDGKVGIGTFAPTQMLEVYNATQTSQIQITTGVNDQTAGIVMEGPDQAWRILKTSDNYNLQFYDATTPKVVMEFETGTGNVGIGTRTPQGKLDVNGSIYQRGGALHADYVFEPEYELESIDEHSEYMWKEKHLSAVPKVQFDVNGREILEIGSHRKGMLEELEKAHIYIEQLNTQIAALKSLVCKDHMESVICK